MENEKFTFLVLTHEGHRTEERYCNRKEADRYFDKLVTAPEQQGAVGLFVAYYCASVGGLVNSWSVA